MYHNNRTRLPSTLNKRIMTPRVLMMTSLLINRQRMINRNNVKNVYA